jgi:8-oxo-dGTP pyrophosphatase MutT (NUDIX family)
MASMVSSWKRCSALVAAPLRWFVSNVASPKKPSLMKRALRSLATKARSLLHRVAEERWSSAGGVVVADGTIALIRQRKTWTLPKGRVDPGESFSRAARREVLEETGLRASITEYLGVLEGVRHDTHWFLMRFQSDVGDHDDEVDEVRFVKPGKARRLLSAGSDKRVLARALAALEGKPPKTPRIG